MNAAKTLVWVMSGMLIALLAVLIVGLSLGWHKDDETQASSFPNEGELGTVDIGEPTGTVIDDIASVDGDLAISLSGGGRPPRIVMVNPKTGVVLGTILTNTTEPIEP